MFYGLEKENIVFDISFAQIMGILAAGILIYVIMRAKGIKVRPMLFFIIFLFPTSGLFIDVGFHLFYHRILLIVYTILFIFRKFFSQTRKANLIFNSTVLSGFFFLFATTPSVIASIDKMDFYRWWIAFLASLLLLIFILDEIRERKALEDLIFTCIITGAFWAIVGLGLFFTVNIDFNASDFRNVYRLAGLMKDPNLFASVLICWLQLTIFWILKEDAPYKTVCIVSGLVMFVALIFTYSRSGYLSLFLVALINALLLGFVFRRKLAKLINRKSTLAIFGLAVVVFIISILFSSTVINRIASVKTDHSGAGRIHVWQDAIKVAINNPIGVGLNNFTNYTRKHYHIYKTGGSSAHNTYFQVLAETGIVGFLAYVIFLMTILLKFRHITIIQDLSLSYWLIGSIISFVSIMMASFFLTCLYYEHVFITAAFIIGTYQLSVQDQKNLSNT